ncbi:MAG: DUF3592 domain-containing protein [Terracidiphilus sp.]
MGWMVADIFWSYLIRYAIIAFKRVQSISWVPGEAHVTLAFWRQPTCGWDLAKVMYKYTVEGQVYRSTFVEPFLMGGNPNGPVRVLPPGTTLQMRFDPEDPARSILVEPWWITRRGSEVEHHAPARLARMRDIVSR